MTDTVKIVREVPVAAEVDVLVAGGGIAGCTAAVAAAREGARVMLVDRFGPLGGNMGPGMFSGGVLHLALGYPEAMVGGLQGIPGEFINRCEGYCDGKLGQDYFRDSQVVSYVWQHLMQENGVRVLLNTFAAEPILEDDRVHGLIVENKSGSQAIRAEVVIDATGDADVAARAGAEMDDGTTYNHSGMYFAIGDVDAERYLAWRAGQPAVSADDLAWMPEKFRKVFGVRALDFLFPFYKREWQRGLYWIVQEIADGVFVTVDHGFYPPKHGLVGAQVGVSGKPVLSGDAVLWSRLEIGVRNYIFETAKFMRRNVPGFEHSYLHMISPYFHCRGGRSVITDRPLTMDDWRQGIRLDDVVFVMYASETQVPTMRTRWKVFLMGQAAGVAAAQAARTKTPPRGIDVKTLQRTLLKRYQAPLGDRERLEALGLA